MVRLMHFRKERLVEDGIVCIPPARFTVLPVCGCLVDDNAFIVFTFSKKRRQFCSPEYLVVITSKVFVDTGHRLRLPRMK